MSMHKRKPVHSECWAVGVVGLHEFVVTTGTNICSIIVDRRWISCGAGATAVWEQNCGGLATLKIILILF